MLSLYWLDSIQSSELPLVGRKALALSQLKQRDFPILPGFVIGANTFNNFINSLDNTESLLADFPQSSLYLNIENYQALQLVARQISRSILSAEISRDWLEQINEAAQQLFSKSLILRTSLVEYNGVSSRIAGLFPSEIIGNDLVSIDRGIKKVWAGLFSAKSLFYWRKSGIGLEKVQMAIIVQPAKDADISGSIARSNNELLIESTLGLGQSILKGEVLSDLYEIIPQTWEIKKRSLGNKTLLYFLRDEDGCLNFKFLDNKEQETYSLDEEHLHQLLELWRGVEKQFPEIRSLKWSFTKENPSQPYIVSCDASSKNPANQQILKGMIAVGGMVEGTVRVLEANIELTENFPPETILVTTEIDPYWLPRLRGLRGIITERGGMTSHAAILARELGIVCLVGVTSATKELYSGERIIIDAYKGLILPVSSSPVSVTPPVKEEFTSYTLGTKLMVNLSQWQSIEVAVNLPINGVGLLRGEWMILELLARKPLTGWLEISQRQDLIEELTQLLLKFARAFTPRPVFYRSWDWSVTRGEEGGHPRGTYGYTLDSSILEIQLQALRRVQLAGYGNVNLILPFVRGVEEFIFCKNLVSECQLFQMPGFQLWIMAEVPSVLFLISELVTAGVQGIAIGSNDLTELILGVPREDSLSNNYFNLQHRALLAAIKQLITGANSLNIPCSLCGQGINHYPEIIDNLVKWGITAISVEPEAVRDIHTAIARAEKRLLLERTRNLTGQ